MKVCKTNGYINSVLLLFFFFFKSTNDILLNNSLAFVSAATNMKWIEAKMKVSCSEKVQFVSNLAYCASSWVYVQHYREI